MGLLQIAAINSEESEMKVANKLFCPRFMI